MPTGDIIKAVNDSSDIVYEYDAGGRLARQKDSISGEDTLYIYDNAGRLSIVQSGNREIVYKYGKNGELLSVRDNRQRLSVDFEYDKMTRETKRTFSNGVSQHTAYDSAGRQIIISEYSPTGTLTRGEAYLYGSDGKRSATVTHTGAVTKYEYNNRGQLVAVHYPDSEAVRTAQKKEAELNGMYYQESSTSPKNMFLSATEHNELQSLMNRMQQTLGARLSAVQIFRSESYSYDANGNRISKTTPFGKIDYKYDAENRLLSSSSNGRLSVTYSYDANGNLLAKESPRKKSQYEYDARNRMIYSYELDKVGGVDTETRYEYDAYGRRVLAQDKGASPMRTVYDGFGFDVIRETASYASGEISDLYDTSIKYNGDSDAEKFGGARKERYHYAGETFPKNEISVASGSSSVSGNQSAGGGQFANGGESASGNQSASGGYSASGGHSASGNHSANGEYFAGGNFSARSSATSQKAQARYVGEKLPLYAKGNVVGVQLGNDASYFGTDLMGSVTDGYGSVKNLREYDVFGNPLETCGYNSGLEYGYAGKPYDAVTEMYNYGFRDYSPATARFTTLDPVRDGTNWFSYVANDPINFVDLWGLMASDAKRGASQIMPQGIQLTVTVIRKNQGYGDLFDAIRIIGVDNGIYGSLKYFDMIGANAASASFAKEHKGMTLPDGIYYLTSAGLEKQADGTFNSNSYKNVLRLQTNDENIPKEIRDLINNDYYLLHANQFKNSETQYNGGTLPRSAGCNITQSQEAHDKMMDVLKLAARPEDIKYIITSEE